jgi:hypothetical protein
LRIGIGVLDYEWDMRYRGRIRAKAACYGRMRVRVRPGVLIARQCGILGDVKRKPRTSSLIHGMRESRMGGALSGYARSRMGIGQDSNLHEHRPRR